MHQRQYNRRRKRYHFDIKSTKMMKKVKMAKKLASKLRDVAIVFYENEN